MGPDRFREERLDRAWVGCLYAFRTALHHLRLPFITCELANRYMRTTLSRRPSKPEFTDLPRQI